MPKHFLEDMVKIKHANMGKPAEAFEHKKIEDFGNIEINYKKKNPRYALWLVALVSVFFLFFALSFLFSKAEIVVAPKTKDLVLNENFSASKDSNDNGLFFNFEDKIFDEENKTIQANVQKDVSTRATGTVVIYNAFGFSPQQLNVDTRLVGSNGKIYKTLTKITVPGMSKKDNTPGRVEAEIYANAPGSDYNSSPLDFNILGFKGTPKYAKFIVRSKTGINGGFVGKTNNISDADKSAAIAELNSSLKAKLLLKAVNEAPQGFILFKDAVFLETEDPIIPLTADQNNNFKITLKGNLYAIIFNEEKLTKKIAEDNIDKYDGSNIKMSNISNLTFSLPSKDSISPEDTKNINFNLSGSTKAVWKVDVDKFMADLLGKPKSDFNQVLSQYPNIDSATLIVSPAWRTSIPSDKKDIKIIVNTPK